MGVYYGKYPSGDSDALALIATMTTAPDSTRQILINNTVVALKAAGIWSKLDGLWLLAAHAEQAGLLNWITRTAATKISTPAFVSDRGFTGGTGIAINTGLNPTTTANYSQNNACLGVYSRTDVAAGVMDIGVGESSTAKQAYLQCRNSTTMRAIVNNASTQTTATNANSLGLHMADRSGANALTLYKNGASIGSGTTASDGVYNSNFYLLALNRAGSVSFPSSRQIACGFIGASLTATNHSDLYTIIQAYMTAIGANV